MTNAEAGAELDGVVTGTVDVIVVTVPHSASRITSGGLSLGTCRGTLLPQNQCNCIGANRDRPGYGSRLKLSGFSSQAATGRSRGLVCLVRRPYLLAPGEVCSLVSYEAAGWQRKDDAKAVFQSAIDRAATPGTVSRRP